MKPFISGIQQIGIGVSRVHEAWAWYRKHFQMDIPVFEEAATAALMLPYTGGEPRDRHAVLAINTQGGGGFEIWQYTSRVPQPAEFDIQLGDLGFFAAKIKSKNIAKSYDELSAKGVRMQGALAQRPNGEAHYFCQDPYGNHFNVVPSDDWFKQDKHFFGGAYGAIIGVSDMDKSLSFYQDILGYDDIVFDETGQFEDFQSLPGGQHTFRRVLLAHRKKRKGPFSNMLGASEIELVQVTGRTPRKMFENRFWGDLGFIHLCFDIVGMEEMRTLCESKGHPFTVDSRTALGKDFDMGEAAGHFSYIEDPDGTLIEFVETLKVPIVKKIGWYLNLKKRNPEKALPTWMLRALALNRVKD
ncbi:MAG: VOC family protein [Saprospiraceae bacterium]|nr:VOC family protein [Saprospiraceae bacterium]